VSEAIDTSGDIPSTVIFRPREGPFPRSAIRAVIEANEHRLPASGRELQQALAKLGNFVQLSIPFSAVAHNSGLTLPWVVFALETLPQIPPARQSLGWDPSPPPFDPLGRVAIDKPNLEGRLFLAANMEMDDTSRLPRVKTIEFISWNSHRMKFEFGMIEGVGKTPTLKFLDGAKCFSCHKNKGPIMGAAPWSNTIHNDHARSLTKSLLAPNHNDHFRLFGVSANCSVPQRDRADFEYPLGNWRGRYSPAPTSATSPTAASCRTGTISRIASWPPSPNSSRTSNTRS
jgi:hypothetical protein